MTSLIEVAALVSALALCFIVILFRAKTPNKKMMWLTQDEEDVFFDPADSYNRTFDI